MLSTDHLLFQLLANYSFVEDLHNLVADIDCTLDVLHTVAVLYIALHPDIAVADHIYYLLVHVVEKVVVREHPVVVVNAGTNFPVLAVVATTHSVVAVERKVVVNLVGLFDAEEFAADSFHEYLPAEVHAPLEHLTLYLCVESWVAVDVLYFLPKVVVNAAAHYR